MSLQVKLKSRKLCNQTGTATNPTSTFRLAQTMARQVLEVFLSSTAKDLQPFRGAVHDRLVLSGQFHCVRQEDFGPQSATAIEVCRKKVESADVSLD
jgi:hypothetical protein